MNKEKLIVEHIDPLKKAIAEYNSMGSGLVWHEGEE